MQDRGTNLIAVLGTALGDAVVRAVGAASGLSGAAPAALAALHAEPGLAVDRLAQTVGLTGSGGVRLADRLAEAGLVERRPGRDDARSVSLWLTARGHTAAEEVLQARRSAIEETTSSLTDQEKVTLTNLAEKVLASVTTDRRQAEWLCRLCDVTACPPHACRIELAVP
mgnify:FL=1